MHSSDWLVGFVLLFSYASLIRLAITNSPEERVTLAEIYSWIISNYPFYATAGNGWKVSQVSTSGGRGSASFYSFFKEIYLPRFTVLCLLFNLASHVSRMGSFLVPSSKAREVHQHYNS